MIMVCVGIDFRRAENIAKAHVVIIASKVYVFTLMGKTFPLPPVTER